MPANKDLKRRVRSRMTKTGESYTTARSRVLAKPAPKGRQASRQATPDVAIDYAKITGISDDAVKKKTDRDWPAWVAALDDAAAHELAHPEIVKLMRATWETPHWWAQTVTTGYERIKGLRDVGQQRSGTYEANKSKTLPVSVGELYQAFHLKRRRDQWLPGVDLEIRKKTKDVSMRITWPDDTAVEVYFWDKTAAKKGRAKSPPKSQVQLQHRKLASQAAREATKTFWTERFAALAAYLKETAAKG